MCTLHNFAYSIAITDKIEQSFAYVMLTHFFFWSKNLTATQNTLNIDNWRYCKINIISLSKKLQEILIL